MIQIGIHKDIVNEYEEKIIGGLSVRKLVACLVAFPLGAALAAIMSICWQASTDVAGLVVIAATIPIWYLGFFRPGGMDPEKYAELWFEHNFGTTKVFYRRENNARAAYLAQEERNKQNATPSKKERKRAAREPEWLGKPCGKELRRRRRAWKRRERASKVEA